MFVCVDHDHVSEKQESGQSLASNGAVKRPKIHSPNSPGGGEGGAAALKSQQRHLIAPALPKTMFARLSEQFLLRDAASELMNMLAPAGSNYPLSFAQKHQIHAVFLLF